MTPLSHTVTRVPPPADLLAAVDTRMADVLHEVEMAWLDLSGGTVDVLDDDLPALMRLAAGGGKRLRPQMAYWGWVAAGARDDAWAQLVDLGAALEILHVFALVHDDVMDRSELRRGLPSVHTLAAAAHRRTGAQGDPDAFGDHIAILAGDLLHAEADQLVAGLPAGVRSVWRTMMVELVLGQCRDLTGAALGRRDLEQAREVARLKSGSYTVARPLQMGAVLGGAGDQLVGCLLRYGHHVGEAFGLRDDILGTWGDPGATGKSDQDDLAAGKPTVLLALAAQRLGPRGRHLLERAGTGELSSAELREVRDAMDATGVRDDVEARITDHVEEATVALDLDIVAADAVAGLTRAAHRIAWRQS